jgi:hypothetical protein
MYICLSRLSYDPSQRDVILAGAEQTNPALRDRPGRQSSYWAVDRATGSMIEIADVGHNSDESSGLPGY